jgi:hypothetical protein
MADTSYFDTAISNFWAAQRAVDPANCALSMDMGLQQFCAGVRMVGNPNPAADMYLRTAIDNFWNGQTQTGFEQLMSMAIGLQNFCAGVKLMYSPQSN